MSDEGRRRRRPTAPSAVLTPPTGLPAAPPERAAAPPARPAPVVAPCACGHPRAAHEHYRRGTDCGVCGSAGCARYRRPGGPVRRLLRRAGIIS